MTDSASSYSALLIYYFCILGEVYKNALNKKNTNLLRDNFVHTLK